MDGNKFAPPRSSTRKRGYGGRARAGAAASDSYRRYVSEFEAKISPTHHKLQSAFVSYLRCRHVAVKFPLCYRDDLRYIVDGDPP